MDPAFVSPGADEILTPCAPCLRMPGIWLEKGADSCVLWQGLFGSIMDTAPFVQQFPSTGNVRRGCLA